MWNHGARHRQIRAGADLRTRSFERALQWFSDHWPPGLAWPTDVARDPLSDSAGGVPPGPYGSKEPLLREAMTLGANGRLLSPAALCRATGISRSTYDYVIRRYADGRDRAGEFPQRNTWTRRLLDYLVASGDVRFAVRRDRIGKALELKRRLFGTSKPKARTPREEPDAD